MNRLLIAIGVIVVIIGVIAGTIVFVTPELFGLITVNETPYAQYMIPLIIAGLVLIIVGAAVPGKKNTGG